MKRLSKFFRYGEKGFTLVEMLIVIAVLGVLAGVVVPNVSAFTSAGNIAASNTEAANVKTAALIHLADYGSFPGTSANLTGAGHNYLSAAPSCTYSFDTTTGLVSGVASQTGVTADLTFTVGTQRWSR